MEMYEYKVSCSNCGDMGKIGVKAKSEDGLQEKLFCPKCRKQLLKVSSANMMTYKADGSLLSSKKITVRRIT